MAEEVDSNPQASADITPRRSLGAIHNAIIGIGYRSAHVLTSAIRDIGGALRCLSHRRRRPPLGAGVEDERENWPVSSRGPIAAILLKWPISVRIIAICPESKINLTLNEGKNRLPYFSIAHNHVWSLALRRSTAGICESVQRQLLFPRAGFVANCR
jgi:hypothetical protein